MIRRTGNAFRAASSNVPVDGGGIPVPGNVNLTDIQGSASPYSSWTQGAYIIDTARLVPITNKPMTIVSASVSASLVWYQSGAYYYGKWGKVIAGITEAQNTSGYAAGFPYSVPVNQRPQDSSLITTLWDPANDPLPPQLVSPLPNFPISGSIVPPSPIPAPQGGIGIGMWIGPSLVANANMCVYNAVWSIIYDDGT